MLELINRYAHGFVAVPVILACQEQGLFECLQEPMTSLELARHIHANEGHLQVALRLLHSLNWLSRNDDGQYTLTVKAASHHDLPDELLSLYQLDMSAYLMGTGAGLLREWIDRSLQRWHVSDPLLADFLDGVLVIPLLLALYQKDELLEGEKIWLRSLAPLVQEELSDLFVSKGWAHRQPNHHHLLLTEVGQFLVERALITGTTASYKPMLAALPELLFGDPKRVFKRDASGHEGHLDRTLNVVASGFQHEKYFSDVDEIIADIFNKPLAEQPNYVADMGCGDGSLLARVYEIIRDKSTRGGLFPQHPVVMIGVDYNQKALEATAQTLSNIPHLVLSGDIGNPEQLVVDLAARGIPPSEVLHIRSFLDHDRPFIPPQDAQAHKRAKLAYSGVYVDGSGASIPAYIMVQSLVEHLGRWTTVVGKHGLIILEVHSLAPEVVAQFLDQSENLHFDAYHAASQQYLVEANVFLMAAAEVGLFPKADTSSEGVSTRFSKRYPKTFPFSRITLNWFEKRPYTVRHAQLGDLPALADLEKACWPKRLQVSTNEIKRRISSAPFGQVVLEIDGKLVGGIYSQPIAGADVLRHTTFALVPSLQIPKGSVIQLLGMNVLPEMQDKGLGDQLLEFVLHYFAHLGGIRRVVGVTRCKNYAANARGGGMAPIPMVEYIQKRNEHGQLVDPILRFHEAHGARLVGIIDGYRPEDVDNQGKGVLIEYDLHSSGRRLAKEAASRCTEPLCGSVQPHPQHHIMPFGYKSQFEPLNAEIEYEHAISHVVAEAVREFLPATRRSAFSPQRPLMEMGLDSLDLLELRRLLTERLGKELEPTFFFRYGTPAAITGYFEGRSNTRSNDVRSSSPTETTEVVISCPAGTTAVTTGASEAIAIIGMGCRFPGGVSSPEAYWSLLRDGVDAIGEVPKTRWDMARYASQIKSAYGGFLEQVDQFDASFFRMAPVEAISTDPQQRILLEVTWEALERAGIDPSSLAGSETGVFVGIFSHDYEYLQLKQNETPSPYFGTGTSSSVAAGRLSYFFGFQGPALSVDTACSSSLVALHLACQSLLRNECDFALASGVNLLLSPELSITFSQAGMLAPDGRCKTFDASANGYVRSEGCGVVVLKRLSDAIADQDRILAVVRGSAINQDGTSNGLTAPNGLAQEAVIRKALENAGVEADQVSYVEAHGTGTKLGDPVEVKALEAVYGAGGPLARTADNPLLIGSVKTNIGHTEGAAGMAGLLKVVLSMQNDYIPPHLHIKAVNSLISLERIPAIIPTDGMVWQNERRLAGVSSFGFSGTNAHVILEEAPPATEQREQRIKLSPASEQIFTLSAKSEAALRQLAQRYTQIDYLPLADLCFTANTGRAHFAHRLALVADSQAKLQEQLSAFVAGEEASGLISGPRDNQPPRIAFLFTGQGSQYVDMGRELYETQPVFRQTIDRCDEILRSLVPRDKPLLDRSLLDVLYPSSHDSPINQTAYTQPALFALEYALAKLWQSWGIVPDVVMGHSVGEYVAACVAGVFSLEDGLKLIAERGRLMQSLPQEGDMVVILASEAIVAPFLAPYANQVSFAAINGPNSVVISGERDAVQGVIAALPEDIRTIKLNVSHAFHSPLMEPILEPFREVASKVTFSLPQACPEERGITLIGNITGKQVTHEVTTPEYWVRHIRQAVRFADGMQTLHEMVASTFVEIGPASTLLGMGRRCLSPPRPLAPSPPRNWLPSLRPANEWPTMLASVAQLYVQGAEIDWAGVYRGTLHYYYSYRKVVLPTYPFQRQRYWLSQIGNHPFGTSEGTRRARRAAHSEHPLLGQRVRSAAFKNKEIQFETQISLNSPHLAYLADHRVYQQAVLPATAYLEMALAAGASISKSSDLLLDAERVLIQQPLILSEMPDKEQTVQIILTPEDKNAFSFEIYTLAVDEQEVCESPFKLHASGKIRPRSLASRPVEAFPKGMVPNDEAQALDSRAAPVPVSAFYQECSERGLDYGPTFRTLTDLWRHSVPFGYEGEAWAKIRHDGLDGEAYHLHPALLDASLQLGLATLPARSNESYLPFALDALHFYRSPRGKLWGHAKRRLVPPRIGESDVFTVDLALYDEQEVVATIEGLSFKRTSRSALDLKPAWQEWLYEVQWQPKPLESRPRPADKASRWLIFADSAGMGRKLASHIKAFGSSVLVSASTDLTYRRVERNHYQIDPANAVHFRRLLQESGPYSRVVYLWGLDVNLLSEDLLLGCGGALHLVQALTQADWETPPRLWLVTKGAPKGTLSVGTSGAGESLQPQQAPLWGLGQVIALEHPELDCVRLDIDPDLSDEDQADSVPFGYNLQALLGELSQGDASQWSKDKEDQVAYRQGSRYVPRLVRYRPTTDFQVMLEQYGLDNLRLEAIPEAQKPLGAEEVELQVLATGLNFRDVLRALGMLQQYEGTLAPEARFGFECAGQIVRVGYGVTGLKVGDEVMAVMALGSLASKVRVQAQFVVPKPPELTCTEAATMPLTFLTAYYGLQQLAQLSPGERVLIHSAAGGVGQAAVQLAQLAGAELFVTASEGKWEFLKSLGIEASHIMNSRTHAFADEVMRLTKGEGVNVVLNSLNGEFIPKSLEVLAKGGRFVEIGKIGIWDEAQVHAKRPDVEYFPFDLLEISKQNPEIIKSCLDELMDLIRQGSLSPLPHVEFPMPNVVDAFRYMAQAKQIGKVVISQEKSRARIDRNGGSYLITGGLGALGLQVASFLVEQGAKDLYLLGRSGLIAAGAAGLSRGTRDHAQEAVKKLAQKANVHVVQADVSNYEEMANVIAEIEPPLRGIVHAAGVLDDGVLQKQSVERFEKVMKPKVQGAWTLHTLTKDIPLDFFVCFSSIASLIGSAGQANYAAANAFMDGLAHYRHTLGLPALSINWGPWAGGGMASSEQVKHRFAREGWQMITPSQGMQILEMLLKADAAQVGVLPIDWTRFQSKNATRRLAKEATSLIKHPQAPEHEKWLSQVKSAVNPRAMLQAHIRTEIGNVLLMNPEQIRPRQRLFDLGLDSLMAVELRNRIEKSFGRTFRPTMLFDFPTVEALVDYLFDDLFDDLEVVEVAPFANQTSGLQASGITDNDLAELSDEELDELSDEELEDLLAEELALLK